MKTSQTMDLEALVEFTKTALTRLADIVAILAVEYHESQWSKIAAILLLITGIGNLWNNSDRVRKLLLDTEKICTMPSKFKDNKTPLLEAIVFMTQDSPAYRQVEGKIRQGLLEATLHGPTLEATVRHFSRFASASDADWQKNVDAEETPAAVGALFRYPKEVDALVSKAFRDWMHCTCSAEAKQAFQNKHLAQLMLWPPFARTPEHGRVRLDMLFSSAPVCSKRRLRRWQNVELQFSWSKRARFSDDSRGVPTSQPSGQPVKGSQDNFCTSLGLDPTSCLCFMFQDGRLRESSFIKPIETCVEHRPGIPLAQVLRSYSLTPRMRVALAYIVAYSMWQYYDSEWVKCGWTSESIQFIREIDPSDTTTNAKLYAWKPCLSAHFGEEESRPPEHITTRDRMHLYPRILALGILLIEIGIGSPRDWTQGSSSSGPDDDWLWALNRCSDREEWGTFDMPMYLSAVKSCLNPQNFFLAPRCDGDAPGLMDDLRHRKHVLYQRVVAPLETVLVSTGWMKELTETEPVNDAIEQSQPTINGLHLYQKHESIKGWKDFVSGATDWQDQQGHGTYLASLILQIASVADIYVARVARSSDDLAKASGKVAEAISWASKECDVDIISMSFGFADDHPCITRAIHEALSYRNGSILFFAAASNYGANENELFPARHESVFSIRATNSNGQFLDLNPPRSQHDGVVFGTLGLDVPSEPLRLLNNETSTSGAQALGHWRRRGRLSIPDCARSPRFGMKLATSEPGAAGVAAQIIEEEEDFSESSSDGIPPRPFSPWSDEDDADSDEFPSMAAKQPLPPKSLLERNMEDAEMLLKQLANIAVIVRKSGRGSRLQRADQQFEPEEHKDLQAHLTTMMLLNNIEQRSDVHSVHERLDPSKLSDIQERIIHCNLKRRNRFLNIWRRESGRSTLAMISARIRASFVVALLPTFSTLRNQNGISICSTGIKATNIGSASLNCVTLRSCGPVKCHF
ncbi:hypothetical protein TgHK011_006773 [Trichoderma gracile]|nr:hypothetical protein TgHK011_006773 [Trichoderma gracile]